MGTMGPNGVITTRVVQDTYAGGKWVAQYYKNDIGQWFDIGDGKDTEAEARINETQYVDMESLSEPERFFYDHAPSSWDPQTETEHDGRIRGARVLAEAEQRFASGPYFTEVMTDSDPWEGDTPYNGPLWTVFLYKMTGVNDSELLGSVGQIDAETETDPHIRVVAAELAEEHIPTAFVVTRDGTPVSPELADENAASVWIQKHQPMSADWAMEHEGYAITPLD